MKRVFLIVAHGGLYDKPRLAYYDENEGFVTVYDRKFLKKGVKTRFKVDHRHVKAPLSGKGKPLIVCDIATRESVNPHAKKKGDVGAGSSVEISSDQPLDHRKEMTYTFAREYMKVRMEKVKTSLRTIAIYAFMGIGGYNVAKMLLISLFGVELP